MTMCVTATLQSAFMPRAKYLVTIDNYQNGQTAILINALDGEPWMKASVALDAPQAPNEVFIKDWSENKGIFESLCAARIIEDTGRKIRAGYAEARVARLIAHKVPHD